jgi:putative membrane protein (TIGR04086 family)
VLLQIHWWRVVLAAVVVEAVLLVIAIPLNMSANGRAILLALVVPLCFVATFLGGWWVARRAGRLFLLHGLLVGALAAVIYGALTLKVSLPSAYIVANYLKLVAGAAGGVMGQWLQRRQTIERASSQSP